MQILYISAVSGCDFVIGYAGDAIESRLHTIHHSESKKYCVANVTFKCEGMDIATSELQFTCEMLANPEQLHFDSVDTGINVLVMDSF